MQIGPKLRLGGSVGKGLGAVQRVLPSPGASIGGAIGGPGGYLLGSGIGSELSGKGWTGNLKGDALKGGAILAGGAGLAGLGAGGAAAGEEGAASGTDGILAALGHGAADATAATVPTAGTAGGWGAMSLADKLALGSSALQGIGGIAGGIAQGQQQQFQNQSYADRQNSINQFRQQLAAQQPQAFNPQSQFATPPSGPQTGAPPLDQMSPAAKWAAVLRARGLNVPGMAPGGR